MQLTSKHLVAIITAALFSLTAHAQFSQSSANRSAYIAWLQYQKAKASGANMKRFWKSESSIGIAFAGPLNYRERSFYQASPSSPYPFDSTVKGNATSKLSFNANANSNHMLVRVSANSIISFSWGINLNYMRWETQSFNGSTREVEKGPVNCIQVGLPLTVEYKWGADVDFDPELKTSFAIGGGVMPMASASFNNLEYPGGDGRVSPYFYASFGFFARGCWKIRASFVPGTYSIYDNMAQNYGGTINTVHMQGQNTFTIGIAHMEHSSDWGKYNAWRGRNGNGGGRRRHVHENSRLF